MKTYYGTKLKMTQVWTKEGRRLPVTIIKTDPMTVTQLKTIEKDGYEGIQVGIGSRREKNITKSVAKHVEKAGIMPSIVKEIKESPEEEIKVGNKISAQDVFSIGDVVTVTGISMGRGFAGVMKRWGFKGGPKTHGQSDRWRAPGSIGQGTSPGRVHKGKKMAGRYGLDTSTIKNLQVVKIDEASNEVWINGPVPGSRNELVKITFIKKGSFDGLHTDSDQAKTTEKVGISEEIAG